jgi:hypothetical protein
MTATEWRFKTCVLARDEWRRNPNAYNGMCSLFRYILTRTGSANTDDHDFNEMCERYLHQGLGYAELKTRSLIPEFVRPRDANKEAGFWWPIVEKNRRLEFLEYLVQYYAYKIDKENEKEQ